jgi:trans-aconitate methyltransferase
MKLTTCGGAICPVCGRPARRGADAGAFSLFACDACGCWSSDAALRGAPTSFQPCGYFDHAAADIPRWTALLGRIAAHGYQPSSALDIGCGRGDFISFLAARHTAMRCCGVEIDAERASAARTANPAADIRTGDAVELLDQDRDHYDLITLWDVLEHVPDPRRLLGAAARRLSARGHIFVQTIHEHSLLPALGRLSYRLSAGRFRAALRRTHDAHHLVFFSRRGIALLAEQAALGVDALWFDRLAHSRLDGGPLLTWPATALMLAEQAWGNGLFVSALLSRRDVGPSPGQHDRD